MPLSIKPITLSLPLNLGQVNCYLIETGSGFCLIDSGPTNQRTELVNQLEAAGCHAGDLNLVLLTHGDFDHTGNAAYLRDRYQAKLAIHASDVGMLTHGNMFSNRKKGNPIMNWLVARFSGFSRAERCTVDILLEEGSRLEDYGLEAWVVHLPGHSLGSIGMLTKSGELFCGDLFEMADQPRLNSIMDDLAAAQSSVQRLKTLDFHTVYPGHGAPFPGDQIEPLFE